MTLELAEFPVKQIRLGHRFAYNNGVLDVDVSAVLDMVLQDSRIEDASVAVVVP